MTKNASVIIVGDLIAAGQGDTEDLSKTATGFDGKVGVIARSLGNVPFLNLAVSGENAYTWSTDATARNIIIQKGSHLISELGLSDVINHGRTVYQTIAALQSVYALAWTSQKIYQTTWMPHSSSTDGWATMANQKALDNRAIAIFNAAARSILPGRKVPSTSPRYSAVLSTAVFGPLRRHRHTQPMACIRRRPAIFVSLPLELLVPWCGHDQSPDLSHHP